MQGTTAGQQGPNNPNKKKDAPLPPAQRTSFGQRMFKPVSPTSLAVFRILWGIIMLWECYTFLANRNAKIRGQLVARGFTARYWGFEWVEPYPTVDHFYYHFLVMVALNINIIIGLFYRFSCFVNLLCFSYIFLVDMSNYLNHFYLIIIIQALLIFVPGNATWALDNIFFPSTRKRTIPKWTLFLVRYQVCIVYWYAGVAKINDDWLRAEPLRHWLAKRADIPLLGPMLVTPYAPYFFSYSGMIYDLIIPFLLVSKNEWIQLLGICATYFFHMMNKILFNIGVFPWVCLALTTLFFPHYWPVLVLGIFKNQEAQMSKTNTQSKDNNEEKDKIETSKAIEIKDKTDSKQVQENRQSKHTPSKVRRSYDIRTKKLNFKEKMIVFGIVLFLFVQFIMPLRYLMYPGDVAWTEYGHRFSWRMKLRDKTCDLEMWAEHGYYPDLALGMWEPDGGGSGRREYLALNQYLRPRQIRKMSSRPDSLLQFAHYIANHLQRNDPDTYQPTADGDRGISIYASCNCALNFRSSGKQPFINSSFDLLAADLWKWPYPFVLDIHPLSDEDRQGFPHRWDWLGLYENGTRPFPPLPESVQQTFQEAQNGEYFYSSEKK